MGRTVDSRVLYDHESRRWVVCTLDYNSRNVILAISKTSSPIDLLTNWTKYLLPFQRAGSSSDFPTLGIDKNGIYVSAPQQNGLGHFVSNIVLAIKKPEIYQGNVISNFLNVSSNEMPTGAIQPAVNFDDPPRGGYAWFVTKRAREQQTNYLGGGVYYRRLAWSGSNASWSDTNWIVTNSPVYRDYFDLDEGNLSAPQTNGGPGIPLYIVGSRLMMAVIREGALWTCQHVGLSGTNGTYAGNETGTNVDRSGVQWLKVNMDTNGQFLSVTNGRIFDRTNSAPHYYYFPSLMVNGAGDLVVGFSGSRSNGFIGAFYSWRTASGEAAAHPKIIQSGKGLVRYMKKIALTIGCLALLGEMALGQGTFAFTNPGARTRMGSVDGALADGSILAQMLVGLDTSSLSPVGMPKPHHNGIVVGEVVTVPGIPGNATAYMQMVAWNGELWGSSLESVPADQFGRTDIVGLQLSFSFDPPFAPRFTQGAIVPVPEPAVWALGAFGALVFVLRGRRP